ncbi:isoprenylcysteine carboxylmethyltransferase family protein [Leisingera daeponensis]|uniref:Isoprenylcysteine carboxylmethyltransferase family protein n=1 Tax=Leisingera daeponensis TaxID=405746 RepID=A0ABS7NCT2_9RHOB|nr:isoprenylcysteine carboxylmethyltransferase family protein [Leisingera daeponensis]MBY6137886.1 isoprenylcysteine carboxylmethyltransferase family protein [Leisingera daeponensis]
MKKLIPPVLVLLLLAALVLLEALHPRALAMRPDAPMPWDFALILGLAVLFWGRWHFKRNSAEIHTFKAPKGLLTDGPFRYSRNPMYLGFLLLLVAAAFYVNTWCALAAPLIFLAAASFWYIPHEEHRLRSLFGAAYDSYTKQTRRWI